MKKTFEIASLPKSLYRLGCYRARLFCERRLLENVKKTTTLSPELEKSVLSIASDEIALDLTMLSLSLFRQVISFEPPYRQHPFENV